MLCICFKKFKKLVYDAIKIEYILMNIVFSSSCVQLHFKVESPYNVTRGKLIYKTHKKQWIT